MASVTTVKPTKDEVRIQLATREGIFALEASELKKYFVGFGLVK